MIWARRMVGPAEWQEVQDQFEQLFIKLGCPGQMMLVATSCEKPGQSIAFASLPNTALLNSLAGFESVLESDLPAAASLLIGHNKQFEKYFRYPTPSPRG